MNFKIHKKNCINLIIVDKSPLCRKAIKRLLENQLQVNIIGEASTKDGLLQMSFIPNADVILMDVQTTNLLSIYKAKDWLKLFPKLKIIALTMYSDTVLLNVLEEVGFKGCILKSELKNDIAPAVECVLSGGQYFYSN
jgi:DNA-binding NarL/FixJ family response regulator